ncbi:PxORF80 peptide [Plutella xylostella granulovirus]|uniref:ORF78 protein n=1 Tax=Plutella xylostella granulovirus TaxID=98383 RepID=Q9DVV3_9BBAC|nr:PxORF80 peptide [Plutella xylostella granulovirus]AAG27378.1 PxORF80 peptide [Plutella xylostella granulovirus]AMQ35690.1 PxGV-Corf78 protein [Plutella xylostella granulovirus]AMQ35807.1 PxGV-Korf78 protein [Plutella xylostella granulovirus]AMQ35924.1 PxGV-Morf78 protein [Plutella xylostella granulovirus]AMQ36041.1 PxGV-Torf78 protein [Plutella xylostella granulovirus]
MKRRRSNERRVDAYRTVTEISDSKVLYEKNYDITNLVDQNEAYIRESEKRDVYLILAKYMAAITNCKLPDIKIIFASNNNDEYILSFVYHSLLFVNNQMFPHSTKFVDMKFVIINERKKSIPGEPIVFYKPINSDVDQTVVCYIDRPQIMRILDKPIDDKLVFEEETCKDQIMSRLVDKIRMIEQKNKEYEYKNSEQMESDYAMDEMYITQFVTMLMITSHAYLGYYKLMRTDFHQYVDFLINHDNIQQQSFMSNLNNLFLTKFRFNVEEQYTSTNSKGLMFKKFNV